MPIHRDQKHRYPPDWPAISARIRARENHRCKQCGVAHGAWGWRDDEGEFHQVDQDQVGNGGKLRPPFHATIPGAGVMKIIEIALTVAHLDHQPENNADENLAALCQRDHLNHDRAHHQATAGRRRRAAMATPDLLDAMGAGL